MKKFTENEIIEPHYAGNEKLRNSLYDLVEETLTPSIDGIVNSKLSMTGKEDLVEEFVKIVENAGIDASIDLMKKIKVRRNTLNSTEDNSTEDNSLNDAINQVYEAEKKEKVEKTSKDEKKISDDVDKEIDKIEKGVEDDTKIDKK